MYRLSFAIRIASFVALVPLVLAACRGVAGNRAGIMDDYFFPKPPDPARIQYLRSYNGSTDFTVRNRFLEYLAGEEKKPDYEIKKPFSIAAWKGRIYVTDSFGLQGLNVFDLGQKRFYILGRTKGSDRLVKPIHVSVDSEGNKYVSDLRRRQIIVYGPDDAYVRSYGDGKSFLPVACVRHGDEVYILDIQKDAVESNDPDVEFTEVRRDQVLVLDRASGKPLRRMGGHGSGGNGFSFASFLAVDRKGDLYVSDFLNHRVVKFDPQGNVLLEFGRHGDRAGDFAQMKGIAVDPNGLIYVVDAAFQLVQVFDASGRPLFVMGGPQVPHGRMDLPAGICIDTTSLEYLRDWVSVDFEPQYLVFVANQLSPENRITVYAYGRREGVEYDSESEAAIVTLDEASRGPIWKLATLDPVIETKGREPPGEEKASAHGGRRPSRRGSRFSRPEAGRSKPNR